MVAYILLVCIGAVGALGLVAMAKIAIASIRKGRAERARLAARERLVAESRSNKQPAVPVPETGHATAPDAAHAPVLAKGSRRQPAVAVAEPAPRVRAMTPVPIVPLARGELTGVISLLDQSAQFALDDPPAPPPRLPKATIAPRPAAMHAAVAPPARKQRPTPPMPAPVQPQPFERPAWADGVVPRRERRPTPPPRTAVERPAQPLFPEVRTALERPLPGDRTDVMTVFPEARTALDRPAPARTARPSAPPPIRRSASAAPHIAPSQPSAPVSGVRAPSRPQFARETVVARPGTRTPASAVAPARMPHASQPPPIAASGAPATRIPVPPAPVHHAPAGQTRLPVPPLPAPPPRRPR